MSNIHYRITSIEAVDIWPLDDIKTYLRVAHNRDDRLIGNLTKSAIISAEQFLGLCLSTRKITCTLEKAPATFSPKYIPILKINTIHHVKGEGARDDISGVFGHVSSSNDKIIFDPKYYGANVEIAYDAGFGDRIPPTISQGILLQIAAMYDLGESSGAIQAEVRQMYMPYRSLKL